MAKLWALGTVIGIAGYFLFLTLFTTYGGAFAQEFNLQAGNITQNVNISEVIVGQSYCDYPRYRYSTDGQGTRFLFNLDNLDCSVSVGALGEDSCNSIAGCSWSNTSNFLWFTTQSQSCTGQINKTFYNDGVPTEKDICLIDGLQGNGNENTCAILGCTSYEPKNNEGYGSVGFLDVVQQISDLYTFRYDFGFEGFLQVISTLFLVYLPSIILLGAIYILSPFSL